MNLTQGAQISHRIIDVFWMDTHIPMQEDMHITVAFKFFHIKIYSAKILTGLFFCIFEKQ